MCGIWQGWLHKPWARNVDYTGRGSARLISMQVSHRHARLSKPGPGHTCQHRWELSCKGPCCSRQGNQQPLMLGKYAGEKSCQANYRLRYFQIVFGNDLLNEFGVHLQQDVSKQNLASNRKQMLHRSVSAESSLCFYFMEGIWCLLSGMETVSYKICGKLKHPDLPIQEVAFCLAYPFPDMGSSPCRSSGLLPQPPCLPCSYLSPTS